MELYWGILMGANVMGMIFAVCVRSQGSFAMFSASFLFALAMFIYRGK